MTSQPGDADRHGGLCVVGISLHRNPHDRHEKMDEQEDELPDLVPGNFELFHDAQEMFINEESEDGNPEAGPSTHNGAVPSLLQGILPDSLSECAGFVFFTPFPRASSSTQSVDTELEVKTEPAWECLPDLILIRIFGLLRDNDRRRASQVSKKWNEIFHSPCLWRTRFFDLGKPTGDLVMMGFSEYHGAYVQNLRIVSSRPSFNSSKKVQRAITIALGNLSSGGAKLKKFTLERLEIQRFWRHETTKQKLYVSLNRFLANQNQLRRFDVHGIQFPMMNGIRCLETVAKKSGHSIGLLNIQDYFHYDQSVQDNARFVRLMGNFKHLSYLYVNYGSINEQIVEKIFDNNGRKLRTFSIKVHKHEPSGHSIHSSTWRQIRKKYPSARINVEFDQIGSFTKIEPILCRGMNLRILHIWSGYDMNDERLLIDLFNHLTTFKDTLEVAVIELDNVTQCFDAAFVRFVTECKRLRSLEINATMEVTSVEEVCRLQLEKKINLLRFHCTCCNVSEEDWMELTYLRETHADMVEDRGLDWDITTDILINM